MTITGDIVPYVHRDILSNCGAFVLGMVDDEQPQKAQEGEAASNLGKGERNKDWTPEQGLKKLELEPLNRKRQKRLRYAIENGFYLEDDGTKHVIVGANGKPADNSKSAWAYFLVSELLRSGTHVETIARICLHKGFAISRHFLEQGSKALEVVEKFIEDACGDPRNRVFEAAAKADEGLVAERFVEEHKNDLRYDTHAKAWYCWAGNVWLRNEKQLAFHWAHLLSRQMSKDVVASKASFSTGVETLARRYPQMAVTHTEWDREPFLVGTPGRTVDLRTGETLEPKSEWMITKRWSVEPDAKAECPLWKKFLGEFTCGNAMLEKFLQEWCGYCATGDMREEVFVFFFGEGNNGKRVLAETIKGILGDYAHTAAISIFLATQYPQHPTGIASLAGKRVIFASETEEGHAWHEGLIKGIVGRDPIRAHFMHKDEFTFVPEGKLWFQGNMKPRVMNVGPAMMRRVLMVDCLFRPTKIDNQLYEKLQAEWAGIAAWIVEGAKRWFAQGLHIPMSIRKTTLKYFQTQDVKRLWAEAWIEPHENGEQGFVYSSALWSNICEQTGWKHDDMSKRSAFYDWLSRWMNAHGYGKPYKGKLGQAYHGAQLRVWAAF
jgi:P4 family phage/plasmid primase-like protien